MREEPKQEAFDPDRVAAELAANHVAPRHRHDAVTDIEAALESVNDEIARLDQQRASMFRDLRREVLRYRAVLRGALRALAEAVDAKDTYTHGHSQRVSAYAACLGKALKLTGAELDTLTFGALLHDVGKIGMPETILRKPSRLSQAEYEIVKAHPVLGSEILSSIPDFVNVEQVVRHHHERLDGAGYPDRLRGEGIGICARVVAVADTFDAITTTRSYRLARPPEKAIEIMGAASGAQLDGELVDIFARLWHDNKMRHVFQGYWSKTIWQESGETEPLASPSGAVGCDHGLIE